MIDHAEIRGRARRLRLDASYVENDYVLCHLLVAIREGFPELVFRGGTALARIYWPDYRLSEDIHFTSLIPVFSLTEILGNKWYMLNDRTEPRDLFDVWSGLVEFDVEFEEIERGHRARYGYAPSPGSIYNAKRLEESWETRLVHQLADLPPFKQVYRSVKREFEEWQERRSAS